MYNANDTAKWRAKLAPLLRRVHESLIEIQESIPVLTPMERHLIVDAVIAATELTALLAEAFPLANPTPTIDQIMTEIEEASKHNGKSKP